MNKSLITGVTLIIIGTVFLLPNFTELTLRELWPVLMLGPGILFFLGYLADRRSYGLLMPGAILTAYGLLFMYCSLFGWYWMRDLWPVYLVGPGLGFLLMYRFGPREQALLIVGILLSALGLVFLAVTAEVSYLLPVLIIILGIVLIVRGKRTTQAEPPPAPPGSPV
jgi:hypothetical protein